MENISVQITYTYLLSLFMTGFESSQALFFFGSTLGVPVPFCASRVSKDFSLFFKDFPFLWFSTGVGGISGRASFFWLPTAVSLASPTSSPCTNATEDGSLIVGRRTITLQFTSVSRRCLSTTLLRGWLAQRSIVLLHFFSFRMCFCVLMNLWGSFREILLFPVFVLFCWRLLLLIFLFRWVAFMEDVFTIASVAVKNLPLEEQFPPNAIGCCHEARNIPCFNVLIQNEDNPPQATIDLVIESVGLPDNFLHHTKLSEVQSKLLIRDEWARLFCYKELLSSTLCS